MRFRLYLPAVLNKCSCTIRIVNRSGNKRTLKVGKCWHYFTGEKHSWEKRSAVNVVSWNTGVRQCWSLSLEMPCTGHKSRPRKTFHCHTTLYYTLAGFATLIIFKQCNFTLFPLNLCRVLQSINWVSVINVNKCQNLHSGEKNSHLHFSQISIYEPFNISSNKMLIVPLGI